ncbi:aspartate ammonia-lyase [Nocardioides marmotae]|uniref:aspartate ammonia-lyase n=1 Tax=Nocardioides marmotae TaxID=2663857 RepID=UPI0012B5FA24|nr:aspartate ammonia-lyase [Nocardioides marmotae]MBC9733847.1 aspartate ammonia-lyase [Nocardioides marmotae]MTB84949.1 aspartate ammonia-lyase [Nocardioides marmotae]
MHVKSSAVPPNTRIETDLLGQVEIPSDAYYGVHTARAVQNFGVSGQTIGAVPGLPEALATVKQAAAQTNASLGLLSKGKADAISAACEEIRNGQWKDQFRVDPIQGGAGTSTNMNVNEVVANRALELMGYALGDYAQLDPLADVNLGQSTNDVYPTAIKICTVGRARLLLGALRSLAGEFDRKSAEFSDVVKIGRTQLQDAVPMTLGQEFGTFAVMVREDADRIEESLPLLLESNLGGTAIGTGINGHPEFPAAVCVALQSLSGEAVRPAHDYIEATQDCGVFVQVSGVVKRSAVKLSKICNDLRLLSSGPDAGLAEIFLPPAQAGSSIMPGKVNPVIPELVNQVAFLVIGRDLTITMAAEGGQLQLNPFEPVIAHALQESIDQLRVAVETLSQRCVAGITTDRTRMEQIVARSTATATALSPAIGYAAAARMATLARATGRTVKDVVVAEGLLDRETAEALLSPLALTRGLAAELSASGA